VTYDPTYAYETAVIVQDGIRRMYEKQEPVFYYITLYNENYEMPPMPEGAEDGIRKGMYRVSSRDVAGSKVKARPQLFGSGPILREALRAQDLLAERFKVASDVWSVTSYKELRRDALAAEHFNRLHPGEPERSCYLWDALRGVNGPFVAVSDYMRLVQEQIAAWVPGLYTTLGTDGFGRSDTRSALRRHFGVDAECIALAALGALAKGGDITKARVAKAIEELGIDPAKADPVSA
jgi:pyruvate dehydrogenase E1 component